MDLRKYPAPPTGHDLMAMFPPPPPNNFEMCPLAGSTIDFLKHQERAFFAQAGKEKVRVEVDFPHRSEFDFGQRPASQPWLNGPGQPGLGPSSSTTWPHHSLEQSPSAPLLYPHPATRPVSVPVNPSLMLLHTPTSNQLIELSVSNPGKNRFKIG